MWVATERIDWREQSASDYIKMSSISKVERCAGLKDHEMHKVSTKDISNGERTAVNCIEAAEAAASAKSPTPSKKNLTPTPTPAAWTARAVDARLGQIPFKFTALWALNVSSNNPFVTLRINELPYLPVCLYFYILP